MHFREFINLTPDPAFVIGPAQQIVAANESAANLVGRPASELIGRMCSDVIAALHPGGERLCTSTGCPVYQSMVRGEPVALSWNNWAMPDGSLLPISGIVLTSPSTEDARGDDQEALVVVHVTGKPSIAPPPLELRLLGSTTLRVLGRRVVLPRRRRVIELLAYLALHSTGGVHRDRLLDDFWPDESVGNSAPRLHVLVHATRQLLASAGIEEALERRGPLYVLDTRYVRIDAFDFEVRALGVLRVDLASTDGGALEQALAAYEGDLGASEGFGTWAMPEVERLRRLYHGVLRRGAQYFALTGAIDRSVECCERALRSDPLQEQFQIALIAYFGSLGRQADAVRQYEDYRRILAADIGAAPTPAMRRALDRALHAPE